MFTLGTPWWQIIVRAAIVYVAVLIGLRLTGRRAIGQLNAIDVVLILIVANAVQNAMIGPDTSVIGGLIAAATLFVVDSGLIGAFRRNERARRFFVGTPVVLINHGQVVEQNMRKERISPDELAEALHEHGVDNVSQVKSCILEVDGSLSVVPADAEVIHTKRHIKAHRVPGSG